MYRAFIAATVLGTLSSLGVAQAPFQLGFGSPPAANVTAAVLWPAFTVRIEDQQGGLVPGATDPVQVVLASGSGTIHGTLTRAAQGGIATFDDLWYDAIEGVTITVGSPGLAGIGPTAVTVGGILQVGPAAPYPTYLSALNVLVSVVPGLEIHVAPGLYQEVLPNPGVVVQGADRETTVFEGNAMLYSVGSTPPVLRSLTIKGSIHAEAGVIEDCIVRDGGGILINGVVVHIRDSLIHNNFEGIGFNDIGEGSLIERCRIENNVNTGIAGDACCSGGGPPFPPPGGIRECVIAGNGGEGVHGSPGQFTLVNCIISGNAQGGFIGGNSSLLNCTVFGNGGDGVAFPYSGGWVRNTIVWGNGGSAIISGATAPLVENCNVQGGYAGVGNIDAVPLLAHPLNGDFHLLLGSPCIDAGDSTVMGLPLIDLDGELRISGASVDMGADEFSGISLSLTQPLGPGSLELRTRFAAPGDLQFVAFTFDPANSTSPGTGWWGGLHISFSELVAEYLWGAPFLGCIDATGEAGFLAPHSVSALPSPVYGVVRTFDPTGIGLTATSNLVSLLVQ